MTDIIGEAAYRIRADTSGFQKEAESGLLPAVKKIGGVLAAAFVAHKIFDFGKDAVKEASITQKAIEAVTASFGKAGAEVIQFNEDAAAGFGISNAAGSAFAAQVGLITDNLGLSNDASADMVINLEKLGGSIAAIQGTDPAETFDILAASLQGSTRGLRSLGITISAAQVQQEAFRLGLIKTVDTALTPAQKAQAIYSLETKRLGELQDQAGKHSDDLANITQRLRAEFDNLSDRIGTALLPFIAQVATVIEEDVIPFIEEWVDKISSVLIPALETAGGFISDHADTILKVSKAFLTASGAAITLGSAFEAVTLGAELLASPIAIVLALGTAAVLAYQNFQVFHDVVDAAVGGIISALAPLGAAAADAFGTINDAIDAATRHEKFEVQLRIVWRGVKEAASDLWDQLSVALLGETQRTEPIMIRGKNIQFDKSTRVEGLIERLKDAIEGVDWNAVGRRIGDGIRDGTIATLSAAGPALVSAIEGIFSNLTIGDVFDFSVAFLNAINAVQRFFTQDLPLAIFESFGSSTLSWSDIWDATLGAVDFSDLASSIGEGILGLVSSLEGALRGAGQGIGESIMGALSALPGQVMGVLGSLVSGALGILGSLRPSTQGIFTGVVAGIISALAGLVPRVVGTFTGLVSSALGILGGFVGSAGGAAGRVGSAIANAFTSVPGRVASALANIGSRIVGALNSAVQTAFNAAVGLGASIVQGIISGIGSLAGAVGSAIGGVVSDGISFGRSLIGADSPSKVFAAEIGVPIAQGIAVGISRNSQLVSDAIGSIITPPSLAGVPTGVTPSSSGVSAAAVTSASRASAAPVTIVHVHFDDPTLKGLINVEIDESDKALADAIAAGTR